MATMHRRDPSFVAYVGLECACIIVNQGNRRGLDEATVSGHPVRMISVEERGLSRSRNLALELAEADICVIADDDVTFQPHYVEKIRLAYANYPEADIIVFQVPRVGNGQRDKTYAEHAAQLGRRGVLRVSSVEMTFRRQSMLRTDLTFDPRFGAGTPNLMGEESIFLLDALSKGLSVVYVPDQIATTDVSASSWFTEFDEAYFVARGAVFRRMSPRLYPALVLGFAVAKRRRYSASMRRAVLAMLRGAHQLRP